jgi:hypothetical protein
METINGKKYYTSKEVDTMIKNSIIKNAKDLAREIKENKLKSNTVDYV